MSPTRVVAVGWAAAAQRLLSWNVDWARQSSSESDVGEGPGLSGGRSGYKFFVACRSRRTLTPGLYLAYIDASVPGRRTLTVRSLKFGSTTTEVVMAHSASDVKTFRSFRFDAGNRFLSTKTTVAPADSSTQSRALRSSPGASFPTGVPAEACFGESLTVDTDYTGVGPGVLLAYNFGCGAVVAKRNDARSREVITVNCNSAAGTCASRTLSIYAVSHKDSIFLNEYPIRICGAATARGYGI